MKKWHFNFFLMVLSSPALTAEDLISVGVSDVVNLSMRIAEIIVWSEQQANILIHMHVLHKVTWPVVLAGIVSFLIIS